MTITIHIRRRTFPERLARLPITLWKLYGVGRGQLSRRYRFRIAVAMTWIALRGTPRHLQPQPRNLP